MEMSAGLSAERESMELRDSNRREWLPTEFRWRSMLVTSCFLSVYAVENLRTHTRQSFWVPHKGLSVDLLPEPAAEVGELRCARQTLQHRVGVEVGVLAVTHQVLGEGDSHRLREVGSKVKRERERAWEERM